MTTTASQPMIGIRELRADLAANVRRASSGHRVLISVDGVPVAQLGPIEPAAGQASLADLAAVGALVMPRRTDVVRPAPPVPVWRGARLDRVLAEIRG